MPGDKEPKPKNLENIEGEKIYHEMLAIAKTVSPPLAIPEGHHTQFGNNFFKLFVAIEEKKLNTDSDLIKIYLKRAEELYGETWKKFLENNRDLIDEIEEALKRMEPYTKLVYLYTDLLYRVKASPELLDHVEKETKIKAIGVDIWNRLNPLLQRASKIMVTYGMNPEIFYGKE